MMTEAFVPASIRAGPALLPSGPGNGTKKYRAWYAVKSIFVTRMDSGRMWFNFSEWGGNASRYRYLNLYYPDTRDAHDNLNKWADRCRYRHVFQLTQGILARCQAKVETQKDSPAGRHIRQAYIARPLIAIIAPAPPARTPMAGNIVLRE